MEWWSPAITLLMWAIGMVLVRRRRVSPRIQILFTVIMFGGAAVDLLFWHGMLPRPRIGAVTITVFWLATLVLLGRKFYKKKLLGAYILLASGSSLMVFASFLSASLGNAIVYPSYVIALVLLLAAVPMLLKHKKDVENGKNPRHSK